KQFLGDSSRLCVFAVNAAYPFTTKARRRKRAQRVKSSRLFLSGGFHPECQEAHEGNDNACDIERHAVPEALEQGSAKDWREHTRDSAEGLRDPHGCPERLFMRKA